MGRTSWALKNVKDLIGELPQELMEKRAEEISPEEYAQLANKLNELVRHER